VASLLTVQVVGTTDIITGIMDMAIITMIKIMIMTNQSYQLRVVTRVSQKIQYMADQSRMAKQMVAVLVRRSLVRMTAQ
jgi:hypothetical protein